MMSKVKTLLTSMSVLLLLASCEQQNETASNDQDVITGPEEPEEGPVEETLDTDLTTYRTWDEDRNEAIDNQEFVTSFEESGTYNAWDGGEIGLSEEEWRQGLYNNWDENSDGNISEEEFNSGAPSIGRDQAEYSAWDEDGDGELSNEEFTTGVEDNEWFADWDNDEDGTVNEEEFTDGVWGSADENGDNNIDDREFNNFSDRYLDESG